MARKPDRRKARKPEISLPPIDPATGRYPPEYMEKLREHGDRLLRDGRALFVQDLVGLVASRYGSTTVQVLMKLLEQDSCSVAQLMDYADASDDDVVKAIQRIATDGDIQRLLRRIVR